MNPTEPATHRRNTHNYWIPFAWAVRAMTDRGYGVTESARAVLNRGKVELTKENVACLRVVYYRIKKLMWPPELQELRGEVAGPTVAESPEPRNLRVERMTAGVTVEKKAKGPKVVITEGFEV